ncbi:ATP-binding SpoIIE family protein phosphatase [Streptacidiphilus fuscans]|uniref:SpoIIE family protein phosphatase n=1 Tax=Streptacidiphilus fuscans TaxID=2789292 RepID=A0A931FFD7_9ACTN|nr:SpoIIE family protein phosphatase [Streptacidiphilus fuscans]MBF9072752.1 SpoIIE family protein phosphatase [Streptacidiphilus fuscans]
MKHSSVTGRGGPDAAEAAVEVLDSLFRQSPIGLAIYDARLRLVRLNAALERIHGIAAAHTLGLRIDEVFPTPEGERMVRRLRTVLESGLPLLTTEHRGRTPADPEHDHVWAISSFRLTTAGGQVLGVASAVIDVTDRQHAQERLVTLNEAGERIGSTLDVTRTAEELAEVSVPRLADFVAVDLLDGVAEGGQSPRGPLDSMTVLRRAALKSIAEHAPEATYPAGARMSFDASTPYARCLVTEQPLLIPVLNRSAQWLAQDPARGEKILAAGIHSLMTVPVKARDTTLGLAHFYRWQTPNPFDEDDLTLARDLVARAAVSIDNARRYTKEHRAALTLQQSLLLVGNVPDPSPIETEHRYLPARAHAGVAGDWFDVIPLSGARVGLVIGDVAGRGIHAVARAGRLRTAVRTLAGMDLAPDELMAQLDALAHRQSEGRAVDDTRAMDDPRSVDGMAQDAPLGIAGTCLYVVYDRVTGHCTMASAGHPPPLVVRPGQQAEVVDLPPGPPLGLGTLPYEASEAHVPDGSILALCTDGLVNDRTSDPDADPDAGLARLLRRLSSPSPSLDALCRAAVDAAMRERQPDDDAVLLLARALTLPSDRVATWDIASDPAAVAGARTLAAQQLTAWGLTEHAPLTELVVSELVTNAVRYGQSPIRLRLIRDRSLICEVSDSASTAPHLRYAADTDEGGRGLFMIAQLADSWGTRYSRRGKTIWAEQSIDSSA